MKKLTKILVVVLLAATFTSCEELAQIMNQAAQTMNLKNCTFAISFSNA